MATLAVSADKKALKEHRRDTTAYRALLVFCALYYFRPGDFIPGLDALPMAKILGGIALIALVVGLGGNRKKTKLPLELKVLLLLFADFCITIPFAYWRGGSFSVVFEKFSKSVIIALLVALIIESVSQIRRLLWIQAVALTVVTTVSMVIHPGDSVRLAGALGGIFQNPNDLAINIAINWPLALAFFFRSKGVFRKTFWALSMAALLYGVVLTYSRSGSIAMAISLIVCLWEFGVRGKRIKMLMLAAILGLIAGAIALSTPHYLTRMQSTVQGNIRNSGDRGSWDARKTLLEDSIRLTLQNPVFGVGPGNFPVVTDSWRVAHNTYTELSAEAGIPALLLFVLFLFLAFRNLRNIRKTPGYQEDPEIHLFASAMWASLAAYVVSAMFASTEYELFPYFMVAYTSALYRIASEPTKAKDPVVEPVAGKSGPRLGRRDPQWALNR